MRRTRSGGATNANSITLRSPRRPLSWSWSSIVPRCSRRWRTGSVATNQPNPWRAAISPSSRTSSSARRTVTRLAPNSALSSASLGSSEPAGLVAARARSSEAIS
jgi:hypothetical protein